MYNSRNLWVICNSSCSGIPSLPPDGGSGGGEGGGDEFDVNLPLHNPKANNPCAKIKLQRQDEDYNKGLTF